MKYLSVFILIIVLISSSSQLYSQNVKAVDEGKKQINRTELTPSFSQPTSGTISARNVEAKDKVKMNSNVNGDNVSRSKSMKTPATKEMMINTLTILMDQKDLSDEKKRAVQTKLERLKGNSIHPQKQIK